ncbi:MAG: MFS transporter [Planctomycetota bacterium]|jgi:OPA family glycerol-3-phosphate transporter-like MFS transporter
MNGTAERRVLRAGRLHKMQMRSFFSMALLYFFYYFCKRNMTSATPLIREEYNFGRDEFGIVLSVAALVYAGGQFLNGFLGDRYGPKLIMIIGGIGTVVGNVFFGLSGTLTAFILIWAATGYFLSAGWAPGSRILYNWFPEKRWGTWMGLYNALCYAGGAVGMIVAGMAIALFDIGWRAAFFAGPVFLLGWTLLFMFLGKNSPQDAGLETDWDPPQGEAHKKRTGAREYWSALTHPKMILCCMAGFGANFIRWGIMNWGTDILYAPVEAEKVGERGFGMHHEVATFIASMALVGAAFFSLVLGQITDYVFKGRRWQTITIGLILGGLPIFWIAMGPDAFSKKPAFQVTLKKKEQKNTASNPSAVSRTAPAAAPGTAAAEAGEEKYEVVTITWGWVTLGVLFFASGGLIMGVQTPMFDLPGDILGKESGGTGVGILDGWMYVAASLAGYGLGWWLGKFGVPGMHLLGAVAIVCGLVAIPIRK